MNKNSKLLASLSQRPPASLPCMALLLVCLAMVRGSHGQESDTGLSNGQPSAMETDSPPTAEEVTPVTEGSSQGAERSVGRQDLIASLTIFVLAVFVGFEVITKVPPTLHTPLMSGSNAISGITLVGAVIVASDPYGWFSPALGFVAVALATINAVGGFMVTHRMLAMFQKR